MRRCHETLCSLLLSWSVGGLLACGSADQGTTANPSGSVAGSAGVAGTAGNTGGGSAGTGGTFGAAGGTSISGGTSSGGTGSGGASGSGGQPVGGSGGHDPGATNPAGCLPEFQAVCGPDINFENQDPDGSANFDAVMTDVKGTMQWAACTVCSIMYRSPDEVPRTHDTINFIIDNHDGVANAGGNTIRLSTRHIANYDDPDSALVEFRGVMVHETAHLYQENGGSSDGALIEGMADFVRIRVGLYEQGRRGDGGSWDDAYTTSGFFFSWLAGPGEYHDDHHPQNDLDIGYRINHLMPQGKEAIRNEIESTFGTDIDTLWNQYQDAI